MREHDAIVIGAGIFGCGIAFELARRDLDVAVVDMNPGPGMGSTSSSGAIVRFSYSSVEGVRLAWEGNRYWEQFASYLETEPEDHEFGVAHKITTGTAFLRTHEELHQLWTTNMAAAGVPYEEWSAEETAARLPFLSLAEFGGPRSPDDPEFWADPVGELPGALYNPDAGYISDPQLAAQNLQVAAAKKGATFYFGRRMTDLLHQDGTVAGIELDGQDQLQSPIVVNVGGPWSSMVNRIAGVDEAMAISTAPMRHEAHQAPAPDDIDFERVGMIVGDLDQGMYFRPAPGNNIFVGSADPECDGHDWVEDMDGLNRQVTEDLWSRQMMRVGKRIPTFGVPRQRMGVAEAYDVSTDWGPIYDRGDLDGYFMACGTSGNQFKNACVASHLMAELVIAVQGGHDHDRDPLVVEGRFTGTPIAMEAFSRNRPVNAASTGTVMG